MWWPERARRLPAAGGALALAVLVAGCTAQPLYSGSVAPAVGAPAAVTAALGQVNVAPVTTREAQEVRNELIFLLSGGRGNPAGAPYELALSAYAFAASSTYTQITAQEQAPNSQVMTFVGSYTITEAATGRVVGSGTRRAAAAYDVPTRQPFAEQRAARDAQNRSARELAALLVAAVAADLATGRNAAPPQ
jgi:LPS-assembly lipoprotein